MLGQHMPLSGTIRQHHQIQTQQDQEWDTSLHMQDVPCIGHLKCKLR